MKKLFNLKNKILILPIALPASGKSTLYRRLEEHYGDKIIAASFDSALEALAKKNDCSYSDAFALNETDDAAKRFVKEHYDAQLEKAKNHDGIVFWDQTNLTARGRAGVRQKFKGFSCVGVYFDVDPEAAKIRCQMRFLETGKKIGDDVIDAMAQRLLKGFPFPGEFDALYTMDENSDVKEATPDDCFKMKQSLARNLAASKGKKEVNNEKGARRSDILRPKIHPKP